MFYMRKKEISGHLNVCTIFKTDVNLNIFVLQFNINCDFCVY